MNSEKILEQISLKEKELNELQTKYNVAFKEEKNTVLSNKKLKPMEKTKYLLGFEFESSCSETPQFKEFYRVFKKEFSALLKPFIKKIIFHKGHFGLSGFFETNASKIYYFSLGDLRWDKGEMLIRTAESFEDYTGGSNEFIDSYKIWEGIKRYC